MTIDINCEKLKDIEDDTGLYDRCKLINSTETLQFLPKNKTGSNGIHGNAMNLYNTYETKLNNTVDLLIEAHRIKQPELIKTLQDKYNTQTKEILELINTFENNIKTGSRNIYKSIVLKNSNISKLYNKIDEYKQINNVVMKNSKNIIEKNKSIKTNTLMLGICGALESIVIIFIFINIYYARRN